MKWGLPFPKRYKRDRYRGFNAPTLGGKSTHKATDVGLPVGTPIYAAADGVIHRVGYDHRLAGTYIEIAHPNGFYSRYLHLSAPTATQPGVQKGQRVRRGQTIGLSGGQPGAYGAGNTTSPHLHFEIWTGVPYGGGRIVDPEKYVPFAKGQRTGMVRRPRRALIASSSVFVLLLIGGAILLRRRRL